MKADKPFPCPQPSRFPRADLASCPARLRLNPGLLTIVKTLPPPYLRWRLARAAAALRDLRLLVGASVNGDELRDYRVLGRLFRLVLLFRLPHIGDGSGHHRLDPDGLQPGLGSDQRGAVAIASLAPHRFPAAKVCFDLFEPATRDHFADHQLGGGTDQPLGQRQGEIAGPGRGAGQDQGLGGKLGGDRGLRAPWRAACAPSTEASPVIMRGGRRAAWARQAAGSPSLEALSANWRSRPV